MLFLSNMDCSNHTMLKTPSEVQNKMIFMGHQILSCHVPLVRSFFIYFKIISGPMTSYVGVYQGNPGIKNCPPEALLSQPWYMGWMLHLPAGFVIICTLVRIIRATGPNFVLAQKNVTVYTWEPITKKKLLRVSQKIFW